MRKSLVERKCLWPLKSNGAQISSHGMIMKASRYEKAWGSDVLLVIDSFIGI